MRRTISSSKPPQPTLLYMVSQPIRYIELLILIVAAKHGVKRIAKYIPHGGPRRQEVDMLKR